MSVAKVDGRGITMEMKIDVAVGNGVVVYNLDFRSCMASGSRFV